MLSLTFALMYKWANYEKRFFSTLKLLMVSTVGELESSFNSLSMLNNTAWNGICMLPCHLHNELSTFSTQQGSFTQLKIKLR